MTIALGFRIKTGFAIAVAVTKDGGTTRVLDRQVIALSNPSFAASRAPYHAALDTDAARAEPLIQRAVASVRDTAGKEMTKLLASTAGVRSAVLVVGSVIDPQQIANAHIRAHALEGKLYRDVVSESLSKRGIALDVLLERDAYDVVARSLGRNATDLRREIDALGKNIIDPWRAEEKLAALAAFWSLSREKRLAVGG